MQTLCRIPIAGLAQKNPLVHLDSQLFRPRPTLLGATISPFSTRGYASLPSSGSQSSPGDKEKPVVKNFDLGADYDGEFGDLFGDESATRGAYQILDEQGHELAWVEDPPEVDETHARSNKRLTKTEVLDRPRLPGSIKRLNRILSRTRMVEIPESDLDEKFVKGRGPGGQAINKTNSSVSLTHIPTGIRVQAQPTRSREENRKAARRILAERLEVLRSTGQLPVASGISLMSESASRPLPSGTSSPSVGSNGDRSNEIIADGIEISTQGQHQLGGQVQCTRDAIPGPGPRAKGRPRTTKAQKKEEEKALSTTYTKAEIRAEKERRRKANRAKKAKKKYGKKGEEEGEAEDDAE